MMVFEYGDNAIVVDCGVMFPDAELPGVDIIIPDITYLRQIRDRIRGIILTHGHEDHIGALPYVLDEVDAPVYGTPFTLALAITTPAGIVIHTGDFKFDPTPMDQRQSDLHTLADYGRKGVLALFSDSTNVERPEITPAERAVRERLS